MVNLWRFKMSDISIQLTLDEVNVVMQGLGQLPYAQVSPVVDKIRGQVIPQVQAQQQAAQAPAQPTVTDVTPN
jgi:hypothetical protein